jgi:hypothetical protein
MVTHNHIHEWGHTHWGMQCTSCDAGVLSSSIHWPRTPPDDTYDSGTYDSGFYDHPNVTNPLALHDFIHLVDFVWFQSSTIGIPHP